MQVDVGGKDASQATGRLYSLHYNSNIVIDTVLYFHLQLPVNPCQSAKPCYFTKLHRYLGSVLSPQNGITLETANIVDHYTDDLLELEQC